MHNLTIVVLTYNEEKNLKDCLDSMLGVPANIFVVDSFSTDNTLKILKDRKIEFVQHTFTNYALQRNWAQENDPFKSEWVFHMDADERLTEELKEWLINSYNPLKATDGYIFSRRAVFMGRWIRYGGQYPIAHLRLFKKSIGKCEDKAYDQHFICAGNKEVIFKKDIINILSDNIGSFIERHNKWSLLEAIEILKQQKSGEIKSSLSGNPIERKRWLKNNIFEKMPLFIRAFSYFFYRYFFRLGFLDGREGLVFHVLQGFWFRFLVDAKVLELKIEMSKTGKKLNEVVEDKYGIVYE